MIDYCIDGIDDCEQIVVNTLGGKIFDQQKPEIFPNPTVNIITVKLPDNYNINSWIEIITPIGVTISRKRLTDIYNTIDISALPASIYYYKIAYGTNGFSYGSILKL